MVSISSDIYIVCVTMSFCLNHPEAPDRHSFTVVDVLGYEYLCNWHSNPRSPPLNPYRKGPNFSTTPSNGEGVLCEHCGAKVDFQQDYGKVMKVVVEGGQVHHFYSHVSLPRKEGDVEKTKHWQYWQHSNNCQYCSAGRCHLDDYSFIMPQHHQGSHMPVELGDNFWHCRYWECTTDCCCRANPVSTTQT